MLPNPEIFGISATWFSIFNALGLLAALSFGFWYYLKKASFKLTIVQFIGMISLLYILMVGGGRIVAILEFYFGYGYWPDLSIFFKSPSAGGFRWGGSLLALLLFLPLLAKKILKIKSLPALLDMLTLSFCLFTIFIKQGCQFSGDGCYGITTNLPWGMYYPYGAMPNFLPAHPTPIYDSLFHIGLFFFLVNYDLKIKTEDGKTAIRYFLAVSIFYILLEIIKTTPAVAFGISISQIVYASIIAFILLAYAINRPVLGHHSQK